MSLRGIGTGRDTKCQNFNSFFEERQISREGEFLVNLSDLMSKFFFRTESILCKNIFKRLISKYSYYLP